MANKRQHIIDYAEDSYSDEDEEPEVEIDTRPRPGRPRKISLSTNSSLDSTNQTTSMEQLAPTATSSVGLPVRRRGRGPSKRPCLNRNALMARENRQRKKEYIERIETKIQSYQRENQDLKNTINELSQSVKKLTQDVNYYKNVLRNQSVISSLLKSMNDNLKRMHGTEVNNKSNNDVAAWVDSTNFLAKQQQQQQQQTTALNWVVSGQPNSSKNVMPDSGSTMTNVSSGICRDDNKRITTGQINSPTKIARKTMPFTNNMLPKPENPSSVESILEEEDKRFTQKSSPESVSHCEYTIDKSPMGLDNQLPTTPMSTLSNSVDKAEISLSDTDFSQLTSFNVDLLDNFDKLDEMANPLQFEQDASDIFNEDTLFDTLEKEDEILNKEMIDPLEISRKPEILNEKSLFNCNDNTGICLHINSRRVSLEYCSICHLNSLKSEVA